MSILVPELWTRTASYRRAHRIDVYEKGTLVLRDVTPGSWLLEGVPLFVRNPTTGAMEENLAYADLEPGGGIIVWYGTGTARAVIFSGRVESVEETEEVVDEESGATRIVKTVGGASDLAFVADRVAHPHPSDLDFTVAATKTYNGVGETQIKALVDDNLGPSAAASRRQANFTVAADQARGSTVNDAVRLDPMGDLLAGWSIRAGLIPSVLPSNGSLVFDVSVGTDRRASLVLGLSRSNARRVKRVVKPPELTFEWVGGQGVGTARTFRAGEDTATEAVWGFRREEFRDRRDTADTTVLTSQVTADLQTKAGQTSVQVEPLNTGRLVYGTDYRLGDTVTVRMSSGLSVVKAVREVRVDLTADRWCEFTPTISDPLTPGVDDLAVFNRVRVLEDDLASTQAAT